MLSPSEPESSPPPVYTPPPFESPHVSLGSLAFAPTLSALASALGTSNGRQLLDLLLAYCQPAEAMASTVPFSAQGMPMPTIPALDGVNVYWATLDEPNQSTAEVSTNELRQILSQGKAFVFDTRTQLEYAIGHIPGALNVAPKPGVAMSQYVSDAVKIGRIVQAATAPIILYCNGPFCGKSRRLGDELVSAGFTNVRRYQLGTPAWRALVGTMVIEPAGIRHVLEADHTAAFIDARSAEEYMRGSLPVARNVSLGEVVKAKDDGRLPMDDFNTRVVVFGGDGMQAQSMAEVLVQQGFNNVKYFDGHFGALLRELA